MVVGGGPAGIAAAVSAARQGRKVLLVDNNGYLGGMATAGLVGPFMTCYDSKGERQVIKGIYEELVLRMEEKGLAIHPSKCAAGTSYSSYITSGHHNVGPFDSEGLKREVELMCQEAGVDLLYYATFVKAEMDANGKEIQGLVFATKGRLFLLKAQIYIDCTGDGDVAASAGVPMEIGREQDGLIQPASLFFEINGADRDEVVKGHANDPEDGWLYRDIVARVAEAGDYKSPKIKVNFYETVNEGHWKVNTTRVLNVHSGDPINMTQATIEGREQAHEVFRFMKKYIPGCENIRLESTAAQMGIRESRRMVGEYMLTTEDATEARQFEDNICLCGYSLDIHQPDGKGGIHIYIEGGAYGIPYRALLPKMVDNLLAGGRCISSSHEAHASLRVMPPCFATGQAAGTAAAIAVADGMQPRHIDVKKLQARLVNDSVVLN